MAYKQVLDLECDTVTALGGVDRKSGKKNPIQVEGYYLGSKDVESPRGKNKLHVFQTATGNLGVWGKTQLNQKMLSAPVGAMIRATFSGMMQTKNGEMYKYKVEIDNENTIEVSAPVTAQASEENGVTDEGYEELPVEEEETAEEEVPYTPPVRATKATALKTPDAARQARVQALLGRK